MSIFSWVGERREPSPQWDLRPLGWTLGPAEAGCQVCLVDQPVPALLDLPDPSCCLFLGVESGRDRADLLEAGAGDAVPAAASLAEIAIRANRIAQSRETLPRRRQVGRVTLDLLYRDARHGERWMALHPREFELLWRLAERPGECVSRARLLREVWRIDFEPGTNTVEVHVSRLRAKLLAVGVQGLVETDPVSGYRIAPERAPAPAAERLCA